MWTGRRFSRPCSKRGYIFWKSWMLLVLPISVVALLLMVPGCCSTSSIPAPTLPVLTSLQRAELDGVSGVWMNSNDASQLAQWIYDVTGEAGQ